MSDFIWVEKYRPKTISECILPNNTKKTFQDFLDKGEIPNMLACWSTWYRQDYSCKGTL